MSLRKWISLITLILIGLVIYFSRHELVHAWSLLERVNIWILLLTVPISIVSYLASGEMMFAYLREKELIKRISPLTLMRMSLEMNFVNHILPSGGVSGISYMTWRLGKLGVAGGRATMAQAVKFVVGFAAFITLLMVAILMITVDGQVNRWLILISCTLVSVMVGATALGVYIVHSPSRMRRTATNLDRVVNGFVSKVTRGKKQKVLDADKVRDFFEEMHDDYRELAKDKKILIKPYIWGLIFTIAEVGLFYTTFWALGTVVNPAPILIAYGVASIAGFIVVTPGGAGAYEAIMVFVLALAGMTHGTAIAGIVLSRVIILLVTIVVGYVFYQGTILKYGKVENTSHGKHAHAKR